jgi:voltage-gated potassium channel
MRPFQATPSPIMALSPGERRRALLVASVRTAISVVIIGGLYFVLPFRGHAADRAAVTRLAIGVVAFGLVMYGQIRRISRSRLPELDAVQTVVIAVALFLFTYASCYLSLSRVHPASFSEPLDRTGALYFTVTTFGTVGYGDIAAKSHLARLLVSSQILLDVMFIAIILRWIFGVSRHALARHDDPPHDPRT